VWPWRDCQQVQQQLLHVGCYKSGAADGQLAQRRWDSGRCCNCGGNVRGASAAAGLMGAPGYGAIPIATVGSSNRQGRGAEI
jgi:hypothetical protein